MSQVKMTDCVSSLPDKDSKGVSLSWIHPDLRRHILEEKNSSCTQVDDNLVEQEQYLFNHQTVLRQEKEMLDEEHRRLTALYCSNEKKRIEISEACVSLSALLEDIDKQKNWIRTWRARSHSRTITATDLVSHVSASQRLSSSQSAQCNYFVEVSVLSLEVHFFNFFLFPSLWGSTCFSHEQLNSLKDQSKDIHSCDAERKNGALRPHFRREDSRRTTMDSPFKMAVAFIQRFFPILSLKNAVDNNNIVFFSVTEPSFIPQPCPLESNFRKIEISTTDPLSRSFSEKTSLMTTKSLGECFDESCLYWHKNQLDHLLTAYEKKLMEMKFTFCVQEPRLCAVSKYLSQSVAHLLSCCSVTDVCTTLVSIATQFLRLGWYMPIILIPSPKRNPCKAGDTFHERRQQYNSACPFSAETFFLRPKCGGGWVAPFVPPSSVNSIPSWCLAHASNSLANHAKSCAILRLEKQLRDSQEVEMWFSFLRHLEEDKKNYHPHKLDEGGETQSEEQIPKRKRTLDILRFALEKSFSALSWRCIIRVLGDSPSTILWLSKRGKDLFPTSPHLWLEYIFSLTLSDSITTSCKQNTESKLRRGKNVVDACLEATECLSHQCKASICTNGVEDGAAGVYYRSVASRYIAYMFVITTRHIVHTLYEWELSAKKESSTDQTFSHELLKQVQHLLQEATNTTDKYYLSPVAVQNFLLLQIAIEESVLHSLERIDTALNTLPLGAISEHAFALSHHSIDNRQTRISVLQQQLQLLQKKKDTLHFSLLDELRSAAQVSMLRTFWNASLPMVEQLLRKSSSTGEMTATAMWMEYFQLVGLKDVQDHSIISALFHELSVPKIKNEEEADVEQESEPRFFLLSLLLKWRLENRFYAIKSEEQKDNQSMVFSYQIHSGRFNASTPEIHSHFTSEAETSACCEKSSISASCTTSSFLTPVEEVASLIIQEAELNHSDVEAIHYLQGLVSDSRFLLDAHCTWLLLMALLRRCSFSLAPLALRKEWFEMSLTCAITVLQEQHLMWWSSIDTFFDEVIGFSHYAILLVYQLVPVILGIDSANTEEWRNVVLKVGLSQCGFLHPLLRGT